MKEWREYRCEENHSWEFLREVFDEELPSDCICSCGLEAVVVRRVKSYGVIVSIVPMMRELDDVTKKLGMSNKYRLQILSLDEGYQKTSGKIFSKDDVIKLASRFAGLDSKEANRIWEMRKLGNDNCFIKGD